MLFRTSANILDSCTHFGRMGPLLNVLTELLLYTTCHVVSVESNACRFQRPKQGPVVPSIVSLTRSLRGQLVTCSTTLQTNALKFFVEKIREAFALHKFLTFFLQKYWEIADLNV